MREAVSIMSFIEKYKKAFTLSVQRSMEYRVSFLISTLSAVFPIIMQYFLWKQIYGNSPKSVLYGFTYNQMIVYVILSSIVSLLVNTGFEWEIANDIKNGGLNIFIIKPIGYFHYRVSCFLGGKSIQIGIMILLISSILLFVKTVFAVSFEAVNILLFIFLIPFSLIINFLMFFSISTIAFWVSEVWGIFAGFGVFISIFSGALIPIDIFGSKVVSILKYLPFEYITYFPIRVLNGSLSKDSIVDGVLIQSVWIVILFFVSKILWHAGTKKYVSIGG
jgi:ABC-2 type transport system permease protein